jgi:hypothetical protein
MNKTGNVVNIEDTARYKEVMKVHRAIEGAFKVCVKTLTDAHKEAVAKF